ncbi:MAG TPA: GNAT family N-acetyltransferase [Thermoanaerobaculia bacterium]
MLEVAGYTAVRLTPADAERLQPLLERCADYFLLADGAHPRPFEAVEELKAVPPNREVHDKFSFGVFDGDACIAYLDLFRDYPKAGEWWIGFLLVDPGARTRGLGTRLYRAGEELVRREQGTAILLGVLEQNLRGQRFWGSLGFEEMSRSRYVSPISGQESVVLIMRQRFLNPDNRDLAC